MLTWTLTFLTLHQTCPTAHPDLLELGLQLVTRFDQVATAAGLLLPGCCRAALDRLPPLLTLLLLLRLVPLGSHS